MSSMRFLLVSVFELIFPIEALPQVYVSEVPYSYIDKIPQLTDFISMPSFDKELKIKEDQEKQVQYEKIFKFAKLFITDINPDNSGEWFNTSKGRMWRVGIRSKNASSLYITLNPFRLNPGIRLFVYSPDYKVFKGAYTVRNNSFNNVLSIAPTSGESLIIELDIPSGIDDYGIIGISKVYHDYKNEFGNDHISNLKRLANKDCFIDINCTNGAYWQTEKKAVCKIITNEAVCTGTLVANTANDNTPYFLTASHCIKDSQSASEAIIYFNYEHPYCGAIEINEDQTLSGASLIATTDHKIDFTLLKLNVVPPASYRPYYAGWDFSNDPLQEGICIHQASGKAKQISFEYHQLKTGSFGENFDAFSTWKVSHWEIGMTENGSSGAPLFNIQHRLVGTLMGGESTCENPINDYFTKFSLSWVKYPNPENQLKAWLDPNNKNETYFDGYDPYGFNIENCDTSWNIRNNEKLDLSNSNPNWGWISGHNSSLYTQFAEKFYLESSSKIFGVFLNTAKAYNAEPLSNIEIKVWDGPDLPTNEKYSKIIFLKTLKSNAVNFIEFDSVVKVNGNFFIGYTLNYSSPVDSFAVYHAVNRGKNGSSTMYVFNGTWHNISDITSPSLYTSLGIGITECYGKVHNPQVANLNYYPNPCDNYFLIDIPAGINVEKVECFDLTGKHFPISFQKSDENFKLNFNLPSGIYFFNLITNRQVYIIRFVVAKKSY